VARGTLTRKWKKRNHVIGGEIIALLTPANEKYQ